MAKTYPRLSRNIQLYLKPGISNDDILLSVWNSAKAKGRPQDLFRQMLITGLMAMLENGAVPDAIVQDTNLDLFMDRVRRTRNRVDSAQHAHPGPVMPQGYPWGFGMMPTGVFNPAMVGPAPPHQQAQVDPREESQSARLQSSSLSRDNITSSQQPARPTLNENRKSSPSQDPEPEKGRLKSASDIMNIM